MAARVNVRETTLPPLRAFEDRRTTMTAVQRRCTANPNSLDTWMQFVMLTSIAVVPIRRTS
jgi:hypothetical protein